MNRQLFEGTIAQVENGFVAKFGCKTFIVKEDELDAIVSYYRDGKVPESFRKYVRENEEFRDEVGREEVGREEDCCKEACRACSKPSFLPDSPSKSLFKVTNGYVVYDGRGYYIASSKEEVTLFLFSEEKTVFLTVPDSENDSENDCGNDCGNDCESVPSRGFPGQNTILTN